MDETSNGPARIDHARGATVWRWWQWLAGAAGIFIWCALVFEPGLGLHLLWNVLIPVAPVLLVVAPGAWRNLCPLGSMSLAPHHLGISQGKPLPRAWRSRMYLGAFLLLVVVVPLRKVVLDSNGPLLALVLAVVGLLAIGLGFIFSRKSGWCSSLCPVYPIELLYGARPLASVPNLHCPSCEKCVAPCSESSAGLTPQTAIDTRLGRFVGIVLTGFFPGFVGGWYQVPTYRGWEGLRHLHVAYAVPYFIGGLTLALYLALRRIWPRHEARIAGLFAASAIMTYYWFRLPPIFGLESPKLAMVADVSSWLPQGSATVLRAVALTTLGWLMVVRFGKPRAWETPPPASPRPILHAIGEARIPSLPQ